MGNDTSTSNRSFDKEVKLFVSSDRQLQMPRSDSSDFEVFRGVSSQLEDLSC